LNEDAITIVLKTKYKQFSIQNINDVKIEFRWDNPDDWDIRH
jgi:hypothetical protein